MNNDFDRSLKRVVGSEDNLAKLFGFGTTRQGSALARLHRQHLVERIRTDRLSRRSPVGRALRGIDADHLAVRLLVAGLSVCANDKLGVDNEGQKNYRDIALFIGRNLGKRGAEEALKVGAWGINALLTLPIFALMGDDILYLPETDDLLEYCAGVIARGVAANPLLSPLSTPPVPWTQVRSGGLPVGHWANVPLIRDHHRSIEHAARKAIGDGRMNRLLDAINTLQQVPFAINEPVLEFVRRMRPDVSPIDIVTADTMAFCGRFYTPLNIDFRGRIYPVPHFSFVREDHIRALFMFADGEPIGVEGLKWLKAHVAARADGNDWSLHKKPSELDLEKRVGWTEHNLPFLRQIGEAVLRGGKGIGWALTMDEPCQFIAACAELVQALDVGPAFITRLPLTFDATCSGLQHLCATTRADEGRYVNLTPSAEGDDIYRRVAHGLWKRLGQRSDKLIDSLDGPFDRGLVKRSVMTFFYGSVPGGFVKLKSGKWRPYGMTAQVADALGSTNGAQEIAHAIFKVVGNMVPKAKAVRDFLEQLAGLCADSDKPLRWTTPLGLQVINNYHAPEVKNFTVLVNGRRRSVKLAIGDKVGIDKRKAMNAVTANFTHSIDASYLQLVGLACAKEGINLVTVHDCFGTTAPRAKRLNEIIREEFVHLHKPNNLLNGVRESARRDLRGVKLPDLPAIGTANIEDVLGSDYMVR